MLVNSTITDNYAEGEGGGIVASGRTTLIGSTITRNTASVGANVGSGAELVSFLSILGPALADDITGDTQPTRRSCRVYAGRSLGYNFRPDATCGLDHPTDVSGGDPRLATLEDDPNGFVLMPVRRQPGARAGPARRVRRPAAPPRAGRAAARPVPRLGPGPGRRRGGQLRARVAVRATSAPSSRPLRRRRAPPRTGGRPRGCRPSPHDRHRDAPVTDDVQVTDVRRAPALPHPAAGTRRPLVSYAAALDRLAAGIARAGPAGAPVERAAPPASRQVPVDRAGDRRHRWGFLYDERDGTGLDTRPALVPHVGRSGSDLRLLRLSRRSRCLSAAVDPNGTGADARTVASTPRRPSPRWPALLRRLHRWERRAARVERRTARFDDWSSCVSWLPVTEAGDARAGPGLPARTPTGRRLARHVPALDLDESEWDDPDYMLLALLGRDDPLGPRECASEPGEAVDRTPPAARSSSARPGVPIPRTATTSGRGSRRCGRTSRTCATRSTRSPSSTSACSPSGCRSSPATSFRTRRGGLVHRSALSFDMTGDRLPSYDVLAFPGEEPPQIECNEDAGGVETDE